MLAQYFTPRALIDSMVRAMRPTLDDIIQDPAAGTGGFLIAANRYIRENSDPNSWTEKQQRKYRSNTFYGMEHVQDTHHLALMNLMLHGIEFDPQGAGIRYGDTVSPEGVALPNATLILSDIHPLVLKKAVVYLLVKILLFLLAISSFVSYNIFTKAQSWWSRCGSVA